MSQSKKEAVDPAAEIVLIVDERDDVVGEVPRPIMRARGLLHRVTYILVFDSLGRLFVQKRTKTKDLYPGYYDLAAGGVVCAGESYAQSAKREAWEELGVDQPLTAHFKYFFEQNNNRCWGQVFSCVHDGPFTLQREEVESGEFMTVDEVTGGKINPVTPDTKAVFQRYLEEEQ